MGLSKGSVPSTVGRSSRREQGFSILELLVAMTLSLAVIAATLTLLEHSSKAARNQTWVADMQDAVRKAQDEMVRMTRMAGRGGLPLGSLPHGLAIAVENDTPDSGDEQYIAVGNSDSPRVIAGTDVLIVRGVISTPVYQATPLGGDFWVDDPQNPTTGTLRLRDPHPTSGIPQNLQELLDAIADDDHPALLLVSPVDSWMVVEIDKSGSQLADPSDVTLAFQVGSATGTAVDDHYAKLSGGYPGSMKTVSHAGLLEEIRFFVRESYAVTGDDESLLVPRLARLRFYPGTELAHPSNSDYNAEIADNVFDLQVALGVDTGADGLLDEGTDAATRADDDWLFNTGGDVGGDGEPPDPGVWNPAASVLHYVRISTLARTDRPDRSYEAPALTTVEDRDYEVFPNDRFNTLVERRFRRRSLSTVIDMRNL